MKIKATLISVWVFGNSEQLKDWPTGNPTPMRTVEPDQPASSINDIYRASDPKNTKGKTFINFQKP